MTENTGFTAGTDCPANYGCTNNTDPAGISPASGTACISDTAIHYTDASVAAENPIKNAQITNLHSAVTGEFARRRLTPKYSTISAGTGNKIVYSQTLSRIKDNLARLGINITGAAQGQKMVASSLTGAITGLNTSQDICTCVTRCTCNARAADTSTCDCDARCACNSNTAGCNCDSRCACNNEWAGDGWSGCRCNGDCSCDNRCACDCDAQTSSCSCDLRCTCNTRTSVECSCNIRNVCTAFVNN